MALLKAKQVSMQEPLSIVTNIFYLDTKKKENYLHGKTPNKKKKKDKIFLGFLKRTQNKKTRKRKETSMDNTVAKCKHRLTK